MNKKEELDLIENKRQAIKSSILKDNIKKFTRGSRWKSDVFNKYGLGVNGMYLAAYKNKEKTYYVFVVYSDLYFRSHTSVAGQYTYDELLEADYLEPISNP